MARIDDLFKRLIAASGSDLHLEEGQSPKYRVVGNVRGIDAYEALSRSAMARSNSPFASYAAPRLA